MSNTGLNPDKSSPPRPPLSAADVPLDLLPTVELNDEQHQRAQTIAKRRDRCKRTAGTVYSESDHERQDVHTVGALGEVALAVSYNLEVDPEARLGGDAGHDHATPYNTIDTKTTETNRPRPKLIVSATDTPTADYFVLVHRIDHRHLRIVGFAHRDRVTSRDPRRYPGETLNYVVPQKELWAPLYFDSIVDDDAYDPSESRDGLLVPPCSVCGNYIAPRRVDEVSLEGTVAIQGPTPLSLCEWCWDTFLADATA